MGSLSIWHWLIVLALVMLLFGTGKLRNVGEDLGAAIKGFKKGLKDGQAEDSPAVPTDAPRVVEGQAREKKD